MILNIFNEILLMNKRKDGRYLNCYITRTLLEEFETVCYAINKTKTSILEDAMMKAIEPFYSRGKNGTGEPVLNLREAVYLVDNPKKPGKTKKVKCIVIDEVSVMGWPYYKIWVDNEIKSVPAEYVELLDG